MSVRKELITLSKDIIAEYDGKITLRQLFYRLVSKHIIPNTHQAYKRVLGAMKDARVKTREISFDTFEDKTRDFTGRNGRNFTKPDDLFEDEKETYESAEQTFRNTANVFDLPTWYGQPNYVEVWCEKDALENVFLPVCLKHSVTFGAARGVPSISWMYDAARRFRRIGINKEIERMVILLYVDHDPSGECIVKTVENYLYDVFKVRHIDIRQMALTQEQIVTLNIPPIPAKSSDSRSAKWVLTHGNIAAAELDAVEPRTLREMVKNDIMRLWSTEANDRRTEAIREGRQHIQGLIDAYERESGVAV